MEVLLVTFFAIQTLLFALDIGDRFCSTPSRNRRDQIRFATLGLLLLVTCVFSLVQYAGMALSPNVDELFAWMRTFLANTLERPHSDRPLQGVPLVVVGVLAYYVSGLWDYSVHRFVSHSRFLWFTHEYHHLPNQVFVAMPGIFVRPFAAFPALVTSLATGLSIYGLFVLLQLPLWDLAGLFPVALLIGIVLTASHSSFLRRWKVVHYAMRCFYLTTPQEHLLHHTVEMDGNYGNFTTVWDRVFGTYLDPLGTQYASRSLGLPYDQDFLGTLTFGRLKLPPTVRARCQVSRYCNVKDPQPAGGDRHPDTRPD